MTVSIPMGLEGVLIRVSVGAGTSLPEAKIALASAKERKNPNRYYNIQVYDGNRIRETMLEDDPQVSSYFAIEKAIQGDHELLQHLHNLAIDPKTGLLNIMGYATEMSRLIEKGAYDPDRRLVLLIDGDDMHDLNTNYGYDTVDRYLMAIGQGISGTSRKKFSERRTSTDVIWETFSELLHRVYGGGGDEFVCNLAADLEHGPRIAQRFIDSIYYAQKVLSDTYGFPQRKE